MVIFIEKKCVLYTGKYGNPNILTGAYYLSVIYLWRRWPKKSRERSVKNAYTIVVLRS